MAQHKKNVKICFIAPKAYPLFNPDIKKVFGGAEVDLYLLAGTLAKDEKFEVSFIVADYGQKKFEKIKNVNIIKSLDFKQNPLTSAIKIWNALKTANADIYMIKTASMGMSLVAFFCKFKNKIFIYRTASQRECDGTYLKQNRIAGKLFSFSLRKTTQIVTQNQNDRKNLKKTIGIESIVIPNAHHLPRLENLKRDTILWVGRSAKVKRPDLFIELAEKLPNEKFVMICQHATGDSSYGQLIEKTEKIDNLEFIKHVPFKQVDDFFLKAKVFVNTSDSEGFPNTFIQACKCATPILSLRVNPDNFISDFNCGICANGNWNGFLQQLKELLLPEKQLEYGRNARKYAEQKHDIKKTAEIYKKLFSDLLLFEHGRLS